MAQPMSLAEKRGDVRQAIVEAALLGLEAAAATANHHAWDWPEGLAGRTVAILQAVAPNEQTVERSF